MKRILGLTLAASLIGTGPSAIAQASRPQPAEPRRFTPPRAIETVLPNGLALTVVPYGTVAYTVSATVVCAGSDWMRWSSAG